MQNVNELRERYCTGTLQTETGDNISKEELNFKKCVIGSDEAGNGEIFRPLIVAAAYVRPEDTDKLIELNVRDSKEYGKGMSFAKAKKFFYPIGEKLTGFSSYKDFEGNEGKIIRTEYATFAASPILNHKFNEVYKPGIGKKFGNLHDLLRQEHQTVLSTLAEAVPYDYIAVDDFQNSYYHDKILEKIGKPASQFVIVKEADGKVIAVACASVIAYYLTNLYADTVEQKLQSEYKINIPLERGPVNNGEKFKAPLRMLKRISNETYEAFLSQYAKIGYLNNFKIDD